MGRVAEKVGNTKGDQAPGGIGPPQHLLETRRRLASAKTGGGHLVQGHELHRAQRQAQSQHHDEPHRRPAGTNQQTNKPTNKPTFVGWFASWLSNESPQRKSPGDQQDKVGVLGVTGQHLAAQAQRPQECPGQRCLPPAQRRPLLHDQLDHRQDERQPRRPGNDHRVHD